MKPVSSEQMIAERIVRRFPSAELVTLPDSQSRCFEIRLDERVLISINQLGLQRFFPTRLRAEIKWSGVKEGGPDEIADLVIRSLADAGFDVHDADGAKMRKTPVTIGRQTVCPNCDEMGGVKRFLYGKPKGPFDAERHILVGRSIKFGDPQITCAKCDWKGSCEDVRFTKKGVTQ